MTVFNMLFRKPDEPKEREFNVTDSGKSDDENWSFFCTVLVSVRTIFWMLSLNIGTVETVSVGRVK